MGQIVAIMTATTKAQMTKIGDQVEAFLTRAFDDGKDNVEEFLELWRSEEIQQGLRAAIGEFTKKTKTPKDPAKPKRPRSSYQWWCAEHRLQVKETLDNPTVGEVSSALGLAWKDFLTTAKEDAGAPG